MIRYGTNYRHFFNIGVSNLRYICHPLHLLYHIRRVLFLSLLDYILEVAGLELEADTHEK